jgi:hypothetical protein
VFEVKSVFLVPTEKVSDFVGRVSLGLQGYAINIFITVTGEIAEVCVRKTFTTQSQFLAFYEQFSATTRALLKIEYVKTPDLP